MNPEEKAQLYCDRIAIEYKQDWRGLIEKIPHLSFDSKWKVKIIPPFGGVMARFQIEYKNKYLSIYLDFTNACGYSAEGPYWEIYPVDNDIERFLLNEHEEMMVKIKEIMEGK